MVLRCLHWVTATLVLPRHAVKNTLSRPDATSEGRPGLLSVIDTRFYDTVVGSMVGDFTTVRSAMEGPA